MQFLAHTLLMRSGNDCSKYNTHISLLLNREMRCSCSLVPSPPLGFFFVLRFVFSIIHGGERTPKNNDRLGSFIIWMMSSGCKVDVGGEGAMQPQKQHTGLSVGVLCHSSGLQMLAAWSKLFILTSKKLAFGLVWNICPSPPTSILRPLTWWMSPGLLLFFSIHIQTEEQKKTGKAWQRG